MSHFSYVAAFGLAALTLSACVEIPDYRPVRFGGSGWQSQPSAQPAIGAPLGMPMGPAAPAADVAETACRQAGANAGFNVRGITGTREVSDSAGLPVSRDVILQVLRDGRTLEVRCSYSYAGAAARIMTL
ncbi:MAG: hypothetical protein R3D60_06850 [Paracoccaceae bacterium]